MKIRFLWEESLQLSDRYIRVRKCFKYADPISKRKPKKNTGMEGHNAMRSKSHEVGFASLQITENSLLVWRYRMNRTCVFRSLNTIGVKFHAIYLQSLAK